MRCLLSVILFGIFLVSLESRRISPNGFGGNFPLSLILFSQVWIATKLTIEYGHWVGIAFGICCVYDDLLCFQKYLGGTIEHCWGQLTC